MEQVSVLDQSDVELMVRVRAGDPQASSLLLSRHAHAVTGVAGHASYAAGESSSRRALRWVSSGAGELPFRVAWLALHARGSLPTVAPADEALWTAYTSLPGSWQIAVWHREVEGERPRDIARLLGMSEEQTVRALHSSYAAMKRRVAIGHSGAPASAACEDLVGRYRFSPPAVLLSTDIDTLREHGRRCDDCLDLVRDLFRLEHTLRETLAAIVLGDQADAYLARRPRPARLRPATGTPDRPERRVRPVLATLSAAAVGAAAMALALGNPALSPPPGSPGSASGAASALGMGAPVVVPEPSGLDDLRGLGDRRVTLVGADHAPATVPAPQHAQEGQDHAGTSPPQQPTPTPVTPQTPPGLPGTPEPGPDPGTTPPGDSGPVSVEVTSSDATVTVDPSPVPTGPVVVDVPLPSVPGVPADAPVGLPLVPGTAVGRVSL